MKTKLLALALAGALSSSGAMAATYSFGGTGPQDANGGTVDTVGDVLDSIATDGYNGVRYDDYLSDGNDSHWQVTAQGTAAATIIIELAGFSGSNTFGIYDRTDSSKTVELFSGASDAADKAEISILLDGSVIVTYKDFSGGSLIAVGGGDTGVDFAGNAFGFYLDSSHSSAGGMWYSDSALNSDGYDHMVAYAGDNAEEVQVGVTLPGTWTDNEYVLAFEDLDCTNGACDGDYTDFMVMVESVKPISIPGSLALLGLGLGLLGATARRKARA